MARTSSGPHPRAGEVFELSGLGFSQRQIASKTGLSQPTVQRILAEPAPAGSGDDAEYRREIRRELEIIWTENGGSFVRYGKVDPRVIKLEQTEDYMRVNGVADVKAAKLARMMGQGELNNA